MSWRWRPPGADREQREREQTKAAESKPLSDIPWANPMNAAGMCTCAVIYSDCRCDQTKANQR